METRGLALQPEPVDPVVPMAVEPKKLNGVGTMPPVDPASVGLPTPKEPGAKPEGLPGLPPIKSPTPDPIQLPSIPGIEPPKNAEPMPKIDVKITQPSPITPGLTDPKSDG